MADVADRTAVAVVRVWFDRGVETGLRIRVTRTLDITEGTFDSSVAASIDEGCRIIRRWLETAANPARDGR